MNRLSGTSRLYHLFPPSEPCQCALCLSFCRRPGWWTVEEAEKALNAGYADQMMLEIAPEFTFGVLSLAFKGCEKNLSVQEFADAGCTFLSGGLCALHGTGLQPLECRFCHHSRPGQGIKCHAALERDWRTPAGQRLVAVWADTVGLWERYGSSPAAAERQISAQPLN